MGNKASTMTKGGIPNLGGAVTVAPAKPGTFTLQHVMIGVVVLILGVSVVFLFTQIKQLKTTVRKSQQQKDQPLRDEDVQDIIRFYLTDEENTDTLRGMFAPIVQQLVAADLRRAAANTASAARESQHQPAQRMQSTVPRSVAVHSRLVRPSRARTVSISQMSPSATLAGMMMAAMPPCATPSTVELCEEEENEDETEEEEEEEKEAVSAEAVTPVTELVADWDTGSCEVSSSSSSSDDDEADKADKDDKKTSNLKPLSLKRENTAAPEATKEAEESVSEPKEKEKEKTKAPRRVARKKTRARRTARAGD